MASPHTAGAAALLRQAHPKLDQSAIKALLQNSTVDANVSGDTDLTCDRASVRCASIALRELTSYAAPARRVVRPPEPADARPTMNERVTAHRT